MVVVLFGFGFVLRLLVMVFHFIAKWQTLFQPPSLLSCAITYVCHDCVCINLNFISLAVFQFAAAAFAVILPSSPFILVVVYAMEWIELAESW